LVEVEARDVRARFGGEGEGRAALDLAVGAEVLLVGLVNPALLRFAAMAVSSSQSVAAPALVPAAVLFELDASAAPDIFRAAIDLTTDPPEALEFELPELV
jgi:hypothetical protein